MFMQPIALFLAALTLLSSSLAQSDVVTVGVCANIDLYGQLSTSTSSIDLLDALDAADAQLDGTVCLCEQAGVLSPNSLATVQSNVYSNVDATADTVADVAAALNIDIADLLTLLDDTSLASLQDLPSGESCTYPANSTPQCSTSACSFVCQTGFVQCTASDGTITCATACPSGSLSSKRRLLESRAPSCPVGFSACRSSSKMKSGSAAARYECVETKRDIEQCGGCTFPFSEEQGAGMDCTAMDPFADEVSCRAGKCYIDSCFGDMILNGTQCVDAVQDRDGGFRIQAGIMKA